MTLSQAILTEAFSGEGFCSLSFLVQEKATRSEQSENKTKVGVRAIAHLSDGAHQLG